MTGGRNTKKRGLPEHNDEEESFPVTLMRMMSSDAVTSKEKERSLFWSEDGMSVVVSNRESLLSDVLPLWFGSIDRYDEFERRLFEWNFQVDEKNEDNNATNNSIVSYRHKLFLRDHPYLCVQMTLGISTHDGENPTDHPQARPRSNSYPPAPAPATAPPNNNSNPNSFPNPLFFRRLGKTSVLAKLRHDATVLYNSGRPPPPDAVSLENLFREASSPVALAVVRAARRALERTGIAAAAAAAAATATRVAATDRTNDDSTGRTKEDEKIKVAKEDVPPDQTTTTTTTTTTNGTEGVLPEVTMSSVPDKSSSSSSLQPSIPDAVVSDVATAAAAAKRARDRREGGSAPRRALPPKKRRSAHLPTTNALYTEI